MKKKYSESQEKEIMEFMSKLICEYLDVSIEDFFGKSRKREFVIARQIFHYLTKKEYSDITVISLGKYSNRDHSTVIHGIQTVKNLTEYDEGFSMLVSDILKEIRYNLAA